MQLDALCFCSDGFVGRDECIQRIYPISVIKRKVRVAFTTRSADVSFECQRAYSGDGNLDLDSWLERDGGDLLDDIGRRGQVDQSLVDPHLVSVPSLGTLTTWAVFISSSPSTRSRKNINVRLSGGVLEDLGGESDGSLDLEVSVLGSVDEVTTDWVVSL